MRSGEFDSTARDLQDIPEGIISVERCRPKGQGEVLFTEQFQAITSGKGRMTAYSLFSGIEASFNILGLGDQIPSQRRIVSFGGVLLPQRPRGLEHARRHSRLPGGGRSDGPQHDLLRGLHYDVPAGIL